MTLSTYQVLGLLALLLFCFGYNSLISYLQERKLGDFVALQVIVGTLVVLFVVWLTAPLDSCYTPTNWLALTLLHFAVAGIPMTWGSYKRRIRSKNK